MKLPLITCFLLLSYANVFSQSRIQEFELILPEKKVSNSLYNSIRFIYSRDDNTNLGTVQEGRKRIPAVVIPSVPFTKQFSDLMNAVTDNTAKHATLFFQLRELNFAEVQATLGDKGYCYFKAGLYARYGSNYQRINTIDTVINIKSTIITYDLLTTASKMITNFVTNNLLLAPGDTTSYTAMEIANIDSLEKSKIPLYTAAKFHEGLYTTHKSFLNQIPDKQITVEQKDEKVFSVSKSFRNTVPEMLITVEHQNNKILSVNTVNEEGKIVRVGNKDIYAIVYNGVPYIQMDYEYYILSKHEDDFYFTAKGKGFIKPFEILTASSFIGLVVSLMPYGTDRRYLMKIDHGSGGFIRIKEVFE